MPRFVDSESRRPMSSSPITCHQVKETSDFQGPLGLLGRVGSMSPVSAARLRASSIAAPNISLHPLCLSPSSAQVPLLQNSPDVLELRSPEKLSSFMQSTFNSINVLCGLGLLSYPFALRCSGWSGILLLLFFTVSTFYTALVLAKCIDFRPAIRTFPDLGREAFGRPMEMIIAVIFFFELFLACSVGYLVVEGDNLNDLYPTYSTAFFMIFTALVVLPSTWLRDLSVVSYLSAFGVLSSLCLMAAVFFHGVESKAWEGNVETSIFRLSTFPQSIGLLMIGYGGHAVFPNIYTNMNKRKEYRSMLFCTYSVVLFIYGSVAVIGYATYGNNTKQEVTLNMTSSFVSSITTWMVILNPLTKYALSLSPVVAQVQSMVPKSAYDIPLFARFDRVIIGTALTLCALGTAVTIPMFDRLLEFAGSLCTFTVSITFPCLCHLKLRGALLSRVEYSFNVFLVAFGIAMSLAGTFTSLYGPLPTNFEIRM